jgi:outer membrane protein TolC
MFTDRLRPVALGAALVVAPVVLSISGPAAGQERRMTLARAVAFAVEHHPSLRAQAGAEDATVAQLDLARAGYLPSLTLSAQLEDGTANVLRGALFPLPGIPAVSGPPTGRTLGDSGYGTLIGAGGSWDVSGILQRMAAVDVALADRQRASASTQVSRLAVAFSAARAFLAALTRDEEVKAASASVERARVFLTQVKALADQSLKPGADLTRAQAELALASTQSFRAQQAQAVAIIELAQSLGLSGQTVVADPGKLLQPPGRPIAAATAATNPALLESQRAAALAHARQRVTRFQYLPRLEVVGALWSRGSGLASGALGPSRGSGLVPDTPNWAAGLVLAWPPLQVIGTRAQSRVDAANARAADAGQEVVAQAVRSQIDVGRAILEGAVRVAENTPVARNAATAAEGQARARYSAGLASVIEVAEAQRLLAQAEIDDVVARLAVWSAKLVLARAVGDLSPFLSEVD